MPPKLSYVTPADWGLHRKRITGMYKKMTLSMIIEAMEREHQFRATPRMYKNRLEKWGLTKKHGKLSRRKDNPSSSSLKATVHPDLICSTETIHPAELDTLLGGSRDRTTPLDSSIYPELDRQEEMLSALQDYFARSFASELWILSSSNDYRSTRATTCDKQHRLDLLHFSTDARIAFHKRHSLEGERLLVAALAPLTRLVAIEDPYLMPYLLQMICHFHEQDLDHVALKVLQHAAELFASVLYPSHALAQFSGWIASLPPSQIHATSLSALESISSTASAVVGPIHKFSLHIQGICLTVRLDCTSSIIINAFRSLLTECQRVLPVSDTRTAEIRSRYIYELVRAGETSSAINAGRRAIACTATMEPREAARRRSGYLELLAPAYREVGEPDKAEWCLQEAMLLREWEYGRCDGRVLGLMSKLEELLAGRGDVDGAERVRKERLERVDEVLEKVLV